MISHELPLLIPAPPPPPPPLCHSTCSAWVGAWWIAFLVCGGVSLILAAVGLRLPRYFHGNKPVRDVTAGPDAIVLSECGLPVDPGVDGDAGAGTGAAVPGQDDPESGGGALVATSSPAPVVPATTPLMSDRGDDPASPLPPPPPPGTLWSRFKTGTLLVFRTRIVLVGVGPCSQCVCMAHRYQ